MCGKALLLLFLWTCSTGLPYQQDKVATLAQLEHYLDEIEKSIPPDAGGSDATSVSNTREKGTGVGVEVASQHGRWENNDTDGDVPELKNANELNEVDSKEEPAKHYNADQEFKHADSNFQGKPHIRIQRKNEGTLSNTQFKDRHTTSYKHRSPDQREHQAYRAAHLDREIARLQDELKRVHTTHRYHSTEHQPRTAAQLEEEEIERLRDELKRVDSFSSRHHSVEQEPPSKKAYNLDKENGRLQGAASQSVYASSSRHHSAEQEHQPNIVAKEIGTLQDDPKTVPTSRHRHHSTAYHHQPMMASHLDNEQEIERLQDELKRLHTLSNRHHSVERGHHPKTASHLDKEQEIERLQGELQRAHRSSHKHHPKTASHLDKEQEIERLQGELQRAHRSSHKHHPKTASQLDTDQEIERLQDELKRVHTLNQRYHSVGLGQRPKTASHLESSEEIGSLQNELNREDISGQHRHSYQRESEPKKWRPTEDQEGSHFSLEGSQDPEPSPGPLNLTKDLETETLTNMGKHRNTVKRQEVRSADSETSTTAPGIPAESPSLVTSTISTVESSTTRPGSNGTELNNGTSSNETHTEITGDVDVPQHMEPDRTDIDHQDAMNIPEKEGNRLRMWTTIEKKSRNPISLQNADIFDYYNRINNINTFRPDNRDQYAHHTQNHDTQNHDTQNPDGKSDDRAAMPSRNYIRDEDDYDDDKLLDTILGNNYYTVEESADDLNEDYYNADQLEKSMAEYNDV